MIGMIPVIFLVIILEKVDIMLYNVVVSEFFIEHSLNKGELSNGKKFLYS